MSKKAASARSRTQRNKPKAQKSFELVRPESGVTEAEESGITSAKAATAIAAQEASKTPGKTSTEVTGQEDPKASAKTATTVTAQEESKTPNKTSTPATSQKDPGASDKAPTTVTTQEEQESKTQERQKTPTPGSASARLAARRQAAQKLQQRSAAPLITSEHFAYVRKDLIRIAVFAVIMFTAIIVLYFAFGRA